MKNFVPKDFTPPEKVETPDFILRKLCYSDAEMDYKAFMSSIDLIRKIRGGNWPTKDFTLEDNKIDLAWKQREFEYKLSFSYTVLDPSQSKIIGCVYFYAPDMPWLNPPDKADVVINMWVTKEAYDKGLYPKLFHFVKNWAAKDWPFKNPYYSNSEIPPKN